MPKSRHRKKEYEPLYLTTGRWLERTAARFGQAVSRFWHDLTLERGAKYYRALAAFCVLCLVLGAGAGVVWRSGTVRLAVERYRAVFLGEGPAGEVTPPDTTTEPTPEQPGEPEQPEPDKPGGSGAEVQPAGDAGEPAEPAAAQKPDLTTLARPVTGPTILPFGWQYSTTMGDWRFHSGVDIQAAEGTPVRAVLPGKVTKVDDSFELGLYCTIDNGGGVKTVYGSLKTCAVQAGQQVKQGDTIGSAGTSAVTEAALGPHVHLEIRDAEQALAAEDYWK